MSDTSDRIHKEIHLDAPLSRVWKAIADSQAFGAWFGIELRGPWVQGQPMRGVMGCYPSEAAMNEALAEQGLDPIVMAKTLPEVFCVVEKIEPERRFAFRWLPFGVEAGIDPETEPQTLVEFELRPEGEGTHLTVTESGFDRVPLARRRRAFLMNTSGWSAQLENIEAYLSVPAEA